MVRQDRPVTNTDYVAIRYTVQKKDFGRFEAILASNMISKCNCENNKEGLKKTDLELCDKIDLCEDVDELVDAAFSCITAFQVTRRAKRVLKKTTVSWCTRINGVKKKDKYFTKEVSKNYQ